MKDILRQRNCVWQISFQIVFYLESVFKNWMMRTGAKPFDANSRIHYCSQSLLERRSRHCCCQRWTATSAYQCTLDGTLARARQEEEHSSGRLHQRFRHLHCRSCWGCQCWGREGSSLRPCGQCWSRHLRSQGVQTAATSSSCRLPCTTSIVH